MRAGTNTAAAIVVSALWLAACSLERTELRRAVSPDGETVAIVLNLYGGGAAGTSFYVVNLQRTRDEDRWSAEVVVALSCPDLSPVWRDNSTLVVGYDSECEIREFRSYWWASPTNGEEDIPDREVEIILDRVENDNTR